MQHNVFQNLLQLFETVYNQYIVALDENTCTIHLVILTTKHSRPKKGRKEGNLIQLGGFLVFSLLVFKPRLPRVVCAPSMAFGLQPCQCMWLRFSQKVLLFVLQNHLLTIIWQPTITDIENSVLVLLERRTHSSMEKASQELVLIAS